MLQRKAAHPMFAKLFEPGYIGKLWLKNRLIKAPTLTCLGATDGCVTDRLLRHYKEVARGGSGLIIVEFTYVDEDASKAAQCQLGISRSEHRPGLEWLAATIKANGAAACLQIAHCGRQRFLGTPPIKTVTRVPWEKIYAMGAPPPEELRFEEIVELVKHFGDAALRAKQAGFDMVEIHGAHGYLFTNFLSPRINKRTDWYGGSLSNRMRFLLEVVADIRNKVGRDYPLSIRLSGTDYEEEEPITIDETKEVAKALEKAGADVIHVSGGTHQTIDHEHAPMYWPPGNNIWCAEEIKKVVSIPVIASGSINTPELAEKVLMEGKADFVSFGRPLLADPYFPLKAQEGRPEDICPCIRCLECVGERGLASGGINCAVNPTVGKEADFEIKPSIQPKKVAVIGGGPAGMEAARTAALRGHKVTLFEKRKLGGMLIEASVPEFKADIRKLIQYLSIQVKKRGVEVIQREATSKTIRDGKFNVAVVATGGVPWIPDIRGLDKPSVKGALDVFGGTKTGKNLIVVGGGRIGCDLALFLAEQGKKVTITTRGDQIARDFNQAESLAFFKRLSKQDVEIKIGIHLVEITENGAIVHDRWGVRSELKADNVVLASGSIPNRKLLDELWKVPTLEIYGIGDCIEPRKIFDAIHEGHWVGHLI